MHRLAPAPGLPAGPVSTCGHVLHSTCGRPGVVVANDWAAHPVQSEVTATIAPQTTLRRSSGCGDLLKTACARLLLQDGRNGT
jgi:hypothetical protein